MSSPPANSTPENKCRIAEIVQFSCERELDDRGFARFHCWPIPRVFRICAGRPAVEITRYVDADPHTGEVKLPSETTQKLPKGKPWRDVYKYPQDASDDG